MVMSVSEEQPRQHPRFAPGWPLWLFTLTFLPILISLGLWQLDRAEQKRQLEAAMNAQRFSPPVSLSSQDASRLPAWQPLLLQGRFDARHIWLLDNRTRDGRAGVEVLQAFHDQPSNLWLVVNRGWLAWPDRRQLPIIATPTETLNLYAETLPAAAEGFSLADDSASAGWPRLITRLDPEQFAASSQLLLQPWLARLTDGSPAAFQLDWPGLPMTASKHTGYAVQWFALATALLGLFIWAGLRPEPRGKHHDECD